MEFFKTEGEFSNWLAELAASMEFNEPPQIEESQLVEDLQENDLFQADFFNKSFLDAYLENLNFDCDPCTVDLTVNNVELSLDVSVNPIVANPQPSNQKNQKNIELSVNLVVVNSQPRTQKNVALVNDNLELRVATVETSLWSPNTVLNVNKSKNHQKAKKERTIRIGTIFPFKKEIFTKPKTKKPKKKK